MENRSVLEEAAHLISNDRRAEYGPVDKSFNNVASMWSIILGSTITASQVALCMVALKLCREVQGHKRDSIVDMCGYAALVEELERYKEVKDIVDLNSRIVLNDDQLKLWGGLHE